MADLLITNARLERLPHPVDIVIRDGRVEVVGTAPDRWQHTAVDAAGRLALPGLVDGHAHIDKTAWGQPWRPHSAGTGIAALVQNERTIRGELPPIADRAAALLEAYAANGTTVIRTHVDIDVEAGLASLEGVLAATAAFADRIDFQIVAFPQSGMLVAPGTVDLMHAAMRAGATLVGGIDPAGFDGDAVAHLDTIFAIADRHGCGVDLHLHDRGALGRWELGLVIERTRALGLHGQVTISHAFCLCDGDAEIAPLIAQLGEHGIGLATVAPGHVDPLPLDLLLEHDVAICLGQDGVRDLWSPWGDADMLARAGLLGWRAGARRDQDIARGVEIATSRGAAALGISDNVLDPGGRGDVVLVDVANAAEAAVVHPPRALVVKAGRIVHAAPTMGVAGTRARPSS